MGIRRVVFLLVALLSVASATAFKAEVKTTSVGVVTISSEESLWSLNATHTTLGECEVITIEMSAPWRQAVQRGKTINHKNTKNNEKTNFIILCSGSIVECNGIQCRY